MISFLHGNKISLIGMFLLFVGFAPSGATAQTNTNRPVFVGATNLTGNVGQNFFYQVLIGGTGREWVGSDTFSNGINARTWSTLKASNGGWVSTNGQLTLRSSSTNISLPAQGQLGWIPAIPLNQSWLAYARVFVSTSIPVTNGQNASAYLQLFQSNRPPGTLNYSNSSLVGWGRGLGSGLSNSPFSLFQFNNTPCFITNFSTNFAGFFVRQSGSVNSPSTAAGLIFSNLGTQLVPTNRLVYLASTNSQIFNTNGLPSGTNGPGTAVAQPGLILPSSQSWEVTTTVYLDSTKATEWLSSSQGFKIGFCIAKNSNNQTPLQLMNNRVSLDFLWQVNGGTVSRNAFAQGTNNFETGFPSIYGIESEAYTVKLRATYDVDTQTLSTQYYDPEFGWIETDASGLSLDPEEDDSLGQAWGFLPGTDSFRLILEADNDYSIEPNGIPFGSGNTIPGFEVPMYFKEMQVLVEPEDTVQPELPGSPQWILLSYDAAARSLTQACYPDDGDPVIFSNQVVDMRSWATNPLPQIRLGGAAAQSNYPSAGVAVSRFSVIPGEGQIAYSLRNSPAELEIDPELGMVTAASLVSVGKTNFTVIASNPASGLIATQTFNLTIASAVPQLAVVSSNQLQYGVTNSNALTVVATNTNQLGTNPIVFSVNPSLSGLGLTSVSTSNSLTIRGIPRVVTAGTNFVISASNVSGVGTLTSTLSVLPAVPQLQLLQNRAPPQYSTNVANWSNAYWTVRVSNSLGQNPTDYPNIIGVSNLPGGFNFRTSGAPVSGSGGVATNTGIISLATNKATNVGVFSNVVFTVTNVTGTGTLTSTITLLPSVPALAVLTNSGGATNSGIGTNWVFAGLAFGSTNTNWFQITNTSAAGFATSFVMQGAPQGLVINPSNGIVSGRVNQSVDATNVQFRGQNQSGPSTILSVRISTLPPAPAFSVVTNYAPYASTSNVLVATITNTNQLGTNLANVVWSTTATNVGVGAGFAVQTNSSRAVFTILATTNSTNAGIFSNLTVSASTRGATGSVTTNLAVLPALPSLLATTNTNDPIQYSKPITNALMVAVTNLARQNLTDFPITFTASNVPTGSGWALVTNSTNAWLSNNEPTLATNAMVRFTASNIVGSVSTNLVLRVLPDDPFFTVTQGTNRLQYGSSNSTNYLVLQLADPVGQNTNAGQFPITWTLVSNPPGVVLRTNLNALTNFLGGTNPTQAGAFSNVTVTASNAAGTWTITTNLTVYPQLPQFRIVNTNRVQVGTNSTNALVVLVTNASPSNSLGLGVSGFGLSFSSPDLPAPLVFIATNGGTNAVVGGTPVAATNVTVSIVVSNLAGAVTNNTNLAILPQAPLITVATNGTFQYGVTNTNGFVITVTNIAGQNTNSWPITFTSTNLPTNGWTLTSTTGTNSVIGSSNPTAAFSNTVTVVVSNAGGSVSTNLVLRVLPSLVSFSASNLPPTWRYGSNSTGTLFLSSASQNPSVYPISYSSPNLPAGLTVTNLVNGNARISGAPTNAAIFSGVEIVSSNAAGNSTNFFDMTVLPVAPFFEVAAARAQAGSNSAGVLVVTVTNTNANRQNVADFPIGFSANLPAGLAFTNTNAAGFVATAGGTASFATNESITITVTNQGGTNTLTTNLVVLPAIPELAVATNGTIQYGVFNTNAIRVTVTNLALQNLSLYPLTFTASNLPVTWSITKVAATNGVIGSVNPTLATNVTNVLVTVTNAGGSASTNLTLRVLPLAPTNFVYTYGPASSNRFVAGQSSTTLQVSISTNGQNTNNFPIAFGGLNLPANLTFSNIGLLSGTPTVAASYRSVFTATNIAGSGISTNDITVQSGAPELVGTNNIDFTGANALAGGSYFRYQVSARGVGQNWAGRSDFPNNEDLTNNWLTNGQVSPDASLSATNGYLQYAWNVTTNSFAYLEWSEPLPVESPWLASVTVNFAQNSTNADLNGLGLTGDDYLGGMIAAFQDASSDSNSVSTFFGGDTNHLSGGTTALVVTNGVQVTNGILSNTSTVNMGWIGLRTTNVGGTNKILVLGNPGTNSPTWSTNYTLAINSWTNAARTNSLILRLSGESKAPVDPTYNVEFSEFVIVPLGDLAYSSTNLPAGLTIDPVTGLITGTLPASPLTRTSTVIISNSLGTTNLTIEFNIQ
jgi:hypothetical protein